MLNFVFYPNLILYQKEYTITKQLKEQKIPLNKLASYKLHVRRSAEFAMQYDIPIEHTAGINNYQYLLTSDNGLKSIDSLGQQYNVLYKGAGYHIAKLKIGFLMPNTRAEFTKPYYIIELPKTLK